METNVVVQQILLGFQICKQFLRWESVRKVIQEFVRTYSTAQKVINFACSQLKITHFDSVFRCHLIVRQTQFCMGQTEQEQHIIIVIDRFFVGTLSWKLQVVKVKSSKIWLICTESSRNQGEITLVNCNFHDSAPIKMVNYKNDVLFLLYPTLKNKICRTIR